ncbi:prephenate dehydratase [Acetobacterium woodii]|uniref:Prephenate dehydratase n=1 Tax=Acetobacterium woodii (strain ATCC 29683 / DSM 1030 / JCM 2381 / KCTC 1655 / WB1) TaxID=931626 RepID=H6LB96_ACEWD|nr:prephenate dehydratase [Acetobacterium woodii]AFA47648.1 bifunctional chorismate mutase/ prephenate dehydratase PheA1 [Acetobacterium woodii DSM 1030]
MNTLDALNQAFLVYPQTLKQKPRVAYAGTRGSYGEEASLSYFKKDCQLFPFKTFEDVFIALNKGNIDYGVLPIENSSTGSIAAVYDLLSQYQYFIVGEQEIHARHCLLAPQGTSLASIEEVYSHPQGFSQSEEFLRDYPQWKCIPYYNTAIAAAYVAEQNNPKMAAIASKQAGEIYNLEILAENINFSQTNVTRFVIISRNIELFQDPGQVSIAFHLPHRPGALYEIIGIFSVFSLNLCKIESRPLLKENWEYLFFIDFTGNISQNTLTNLIPIIQEKVEYFQFLGYYPPYSENNDTAL